MNPIDVAQRYFDAWNRRDPAAVLATMAPQGTYTDPGGPLTGDAFVAYMQGLNTMWVRCPSCQAMVDYAAKQGSCPCGAPLPQPMAYW